MEYVFGLWAIPTDDTKKGVLLHFSGTWEQACMIRDAITGAGLGMGWQPNYEPEPLPTHDPPALQDAERAIDLSVALGHRNNTEAEHD